MILTDWAHEVGLTVDALWNRLNVTKWSVERALTEPARNKLPQLLVLVQNAGYPNVNAFLKANSISPATFYKLASGKGLRPATRARLSSLLGVEV